MIERPKKKEIKEADFYSDQYQVDQGWNACIDAWEAWERSQPKDAVSVDEIKDVLRGHLIDLPFRLNGKDTLRSDYVVKKIITLITRKLKGQDNEAK